MSSFQERLEIVRARMKNACDRAGRDVSEVQLVAVSKTHPPEAIREASECGQTVFGENKIQEAAAKISMCPSGLTWHMIGHLQRNKARKAVQLFDMIHSIDSLRLLETIEAAAADAGKDMPVLFEVNVSGEGSKFGMAPDELSALVEASTQCMHLSLMGLMTMPPYCEEAEKVRGHFARLRALKADCEEQLGAPLPELSMGMSHDFEVAIEEGATMIRVGTDLFGER